MRKPSLIAAALVAALCLSGAAAPSPAQPPTRLRGSDCLDPSSARAFYNLDDHHVLVDSGRNRYLIQIASSCWNLNTASVIGFRGDAVSNRVCGGVMDAILVRGEPPCRIERMELLSKEQYAAALKDRAAWRRAQRAGREAAKQKR